MAKVNKIVSGKLIGLLFVFLLMFSGIAFGAEKGWYKCDNGTYINGKLYEEGQYYNIYDTLAYQPTEASVVFTRANIEATGILITTATGSEPSTSVAIILTQDGSENSLDNTVFTVGGGQFMTGKTGLYDKDGNFPVMSKYDLTIEGTDAPGYYQEVALTNFTLQSTDFQESKKGDSFLPVIIDRENDNQSKRDIQLEDGRSLSFGSSDDIIMSFSQSAASPYLVMSDKLNESTQIINLPGMKLVMVDEYIPISASATYYYTDSVLPASSVLVSSYAVIEDSAAGANSIGIGTKGPGASDFVYNALGNTGGVSAGLAAGTAVMSKVMSTSMNIIIASVADNDPQDIGSAFTAGTGAIRLKTTYITTEDK